MGNDDQCGTELGNICKYAAFQGVVQMSLAFIEPEHRGLALDRPGNHDALTLLRSLSRRNTPTGTWGVDAKVTGFWHTLAMTGKPEKGVTERRSEAPPTRDEERAERPKEIGGPKGPEPTRYGDWERGGRCIDF